MTEQTRAQQKKRPRLVVRITEQTISFSALSQREDRIMDFEVHKVQPGISIAVNLREAFKESQLAECLWQEVLVEMSTPVVIVPVEEFQEKSQETLYRMSIKAKETDIVRRYIVSQLNAVALFSVNSDLDLVLKDRFQQVEYSHLCVPVWCHLHKRSFKSAAKKIYCYFYGKAFDVFSFKRNRFCFMNTFEATGAMNVAYYLLQVAKTLAFNSEKDELYIAGDMEDKAALLDKLREFLPKTYAINPAAEYNRSEITAIEGFTYDLMTLYVKD